MHKYGDDRAPNKLTHFFDALVPANVVTVTGVNGDLRSRVHHDLTVLVRDKGRTPAPTFGLAAVVNQVR